MFQEETRNPKEDNVLKETALPKQDLREVPLFFFFPNVPFVFYTLMLLRFFIRIVCFLKLDGS